MPYTVVPVCLHGSWQESQLLPDDAGMTRCWPLAVTEPSGTDGLIYAPPKSRIQLSVDTPVGCGRSYPAGCVWARAAFVCLAYNLPREAWLWASLVVLVFVFFFASLICNDDLILRNILFIPGPE